MLDPDSDSGLAELQAFDAEMERIAAQQLAAQPSRPQAAGAAAAAGSSGVRAPQPGGLTASGAQPAPGPMASAEVREGAWQQQPVAQQQQQAAQAPVKTELDVSEYDGCI